MKSLVYFLCLTLVSCSQSEQKLTERHMFPSQLVPSGYSVLDSIAGNLNFDKAIDFILVLRNNIEDSVMNSDTIKRPVLLILGLTDGSYKLAERNDNAIHCKACAPEDPYFSTTIKDGSFSIKHNVASGPQHWQEITTFKFDISKLTWFLFETRFISFSLNPDTDEKAEALIKNTDEIKTNKDFGLLPFINYNIYNDRGW